MPKKKTSSEKDRPEVRTGKICLSVGDETREYFISQIKQYLHLQNMIIIIREELYKKSEPEKYLKRFFENEIYREKKAKEHEELFEKREPPELDFCEESKVKHKKLLIYFSTPEAIRALFQKENKEKRQKAQKTADENVRRKDERAYEEAIEKRKTKEGSLSPREKSDILKNELKDLSIFIEFLDVGSRLKSHVIFNLSKRIEAAYGLAFDNYAETGLLHLPKPQKIDSKSSYYLNLCSNSMKLNGLQLNINIGKKAKIILLKESSIEGYEKK